ncbi:hypothetical protein O3P69_011864 [Scylla paramamosain]|uniref:Uncharacterized protein n=1 Tax=Scylla paramamosain TaxID=85552 RepID=A0AAW0SIG2_SCYPA
MGESPAMPRGNDCPSQDLDVIQGSEMDEFPPLTAGKCGPLSLPRDPRRPSTLARRTGFLHGSQQRKTMAGQSPFDSPLKKYILEGHTRALGNGSSLVIAVWGHNIPEVPPLLQDSFIIGDWTVTCRRVERGGNPPPNMPSHLVHPAPLPRVRWLYRPLLDWWIPPSPSLVRLVLQQLTHQVAAQGRDDTLHSALPDVRPSNEAPPSLITDNMAITAPGREDTQHWL